MRKLSKIDALGVFTLAAASLTATPAHAVVGFADTVIDYFNSGAGPFPGPYGGTFPGAFPVPVSTSVVLGTDGPIADFLSLPRGSYVTVGFTDEFVTDGVGNDIFISEVGASGEMANIFVTGDLVNYVLLGVANDASVTSFDLASIGFVGNVLGVRIVGLDNFGGSPGFDVANIQVLPGSFTPRVPEPATWLQMILGLGILGYMRRRAGRKARQAFA